MAKKSCRNIVRGDGVDRIGTLPDDILVRILSLIPTEQAVTTSLLAKRWKSLWTLLPNLDLDFVRFSRKFNALCSDDQKRRFLDFVEYVFFHRGTEPLRMLRLAFDITKFDNYTSKASLLVKFAMRSDCLSLDLDFSPIQPQFIFGYDALYTMPPCFFPHPSVTQLKLTNCKLVPSFYKSFTTVTIVKFKTVQLQKDSVYDLVSKCPSLLELHLVYCQVLSSVFELTAPESNLKCLVMQHCLGNGKLPFKHASIHIPTLLKLKYKEPFGSGYLSIDKSENLTEAEIDIRNSPSNQHKLLCKLLKDLQNVKSLTLFPRSLEVLTTIGGINLLTPFNNLKHLTVNLQHLDKELLGLMHLLRSSPHLETLSLDFHYGFYQTEDELISSFSKVDKEVLQPHLLSSIGVAHLIKTKIENFQGLKVEMEFVKHIMQSSLCLKEIVICMNSRYQYLKERLGEEHSKTLKKKKAEAIEILLACTRASPDAKILLK